MPSLIVDFIISITPEVGRPVGRALEENRDGFLVTFHRSEPLRIGPGSPNARYLEILDDLRAAKSPVYLEMGDDRAIQTLRVPHVAQVVSVHVTAENDIEVRLFPSHGRFTINRDRLGGQFESLINARPYALQLVTADDAQQIIDFRPSPEDLPRPIRPDPIKPPPPLYEWWRYWLQRWFKFRRWICFLLGCWRWRCVMYGRAWQLFNLCAGTSCFPLTPSAPCIPFMYPDDGCWARAHEMCRLMIADGAEPDKVWIFGSLKVATRNNPTCEVSWWYHVAPTLCVRYLFGHTATYVIDPSLFDGPVPLQTWIDVQGDPAPTIIHTSSSVFSYPSTTDPSYVQTNAVLATYRSALMGRAMSTAGPPYADCMI